jgi:hypothetical protein
MMMTKRDPYLSTNQRSSDKRDPYLSTNQRSPIFRPISESITPVLNNKPVKNTRLITLVRGKWYHIHTSSGRSKYNHGYRIFAIKY